MFGLDLRSLALARVCFGLLLLFDLANRARSLVAHYTDAVVIPRGVLLDFYQNPFVISLHLMSGAWQIQAVLFCIAAVFAIMLLVGYKTRLTTIISWFLLISLQNRNPLILQGGDVLMRVTLFFFIFLPWGEYFSVDQAKREQANPTGDAPKNYLHLSGAAIAYILQIVFLYWFATLFKSGAEWVHDGTAIYFALSIDQFATYFGKFLLQFGKLLKPMTFSVLALEAFGPFLFFMPILTQWLRLTGVLLFMGLHIGLGSSMHLGPFPFINIITVVALLPGLFWTFVAKLARKGKTESIVAHYDSECGFCRKIIHYFKVFFILPATSISPASNDPSIFSDMMSHKSWVITDGQNNHYFKFEGFKKIVAASPLVSFIGPVLRIPAINRFGNTERMGCQPPQTPVFSVCTTPGP